MHWKNNVGKTPEAFDLREIWLNRIWKVFQAEYNSEKNLNLLG